MGLGGWGGGVQKVGRARGKLTRPSCDPNIESW